MRNSVQILQPLSKIADRTPRVDKNGKHWYWNAPTKRWRRDYDKDPEELKQKRKTKPKGSKEALKPKDSEATLRPKDSELTLNPKESANEIKPARLSDRRDLMNQLKGWETDLTRLGAAANDAIAAHQFKELIEELNNDLEDLFQQADTLSSEQRKRNAEKLERLYRGRIDRFDAKIAKAQKLYFEATNPTKQIKVPKGTTQREYADIVQKLVDGDKQAIAQYTVKKPKKKTKKLKPKK
jgi:hypothetical protein